MTKPKPTIKQAVVTTGIVCAIVLSFFIGLTLGKSGEMPDGYTLLSEDIANNCTDGGSTRARSNIVYILVADKDLQSFLNAAQNRGRCISTVSNN